MPLARQLIVNPDQSGCYHIISRCVRRAFLCTQQSPQARDLKELIASLLKTLSTSFAVDVLSYALMDNHFHLVLRTQPKRRDEWTDFAVADRWCACNPRRLRDGSYEPWEHSAILGFAQNAAWVAERRQRLGSLSWFNKLLKERIARSANKEDGCTGHFWEGRFKCVPLLDQAAVLAAMAYVDLNPIRAKMASTPEDSAYTSVQARITSRQEWRKAQELAQAKPVLPSIRSVAERRAQQGPEHGLWCAAMKVSQLCEIQSTLTLDDYLELVDASGRIIRSGKRGSIPAHLRPILERLDIDVEHWIATMTGRTMFLGSAIGSATARAAEATRRGIRWIADRTQGLYNRAQQLQI